MDNATQAAMWSKRTGKIQIHAKDCSMLNAAQANRMGSVWVGPLSEEGLADLVERGYPVTRCKCTK